MTRKIEWENWNSKIEDLEAQKKKERDRSTDKDDKDFDEERPMGFMTFDTMGNDNVYTPWGAFHKDNPLKPTDRFDCWLGHTNFTVGKPELYILNKKIEGIAALAILDKYTFCIGIARSFNFKDVRSQIEEKIYNRDKSEADN